MQNLKTIQQELSAFRDKNDGLYHIFNIKPTFTTQGKRYSWTLKRIRHLLYDKMLPSDSMLVTISTEQGKPYVTTTKYVDQDIMAVELSPRIFIYTTDDEVFERLHNEHCWEQDHSEDISMMLACMGFIVLVFVCSVLQHHFQFFSQLFSTTSDIIRMDILQEMFNLTQFFNKNVSSPS